MAFGPTPVAGTFGFTAVAMDTLGATEYTVVVVAADCSGSVSPFVKEEEKVLSAIVEACRLSPRADNLLFRTTRFDHRMVEIHGFKPLSDCNPADYVGTIPPNGGSTALFDASVNAIESATRYGKDLVDNDFSANAIVFVITDGGESGASKMTAAEVKKTLQRAVASESLESIITILIGVNVADQYLSGLLTNYAADAGFTQYIELENADAKTLSKLAAFISKSISSQSQALGTGGPSQSLTF